MNPLYTSGDQIKENLMDRPCGAHGKQTEISAGSEDNRTIGRPRPGWEKNINVCLKEIGRAWTEFIWLRMSDSGSLLYAFFWVIPRRLNFIYRLFGTHCLFHLHRRVGIRV
jgi:hypothetical protein